MLKIKKVSEVIGKKVFTDTGDYFGEVEEGNLIENKVESWRIRISSSIGSFLGGAKGVIIPHQFVRAIGDVVLISKSSLPMEEGENSVEETIDLREA
ncbi:PRC-barrel domain-containing protein [Candidatus Pacearchaeota archaeon]|nr:PRC-barrel domain-containing protein [Candidatus Pacearchaeota archaeon]